MLNQFCLGEHNGFLRVATTTGEEWDSSTWDNHITVFDDKLNQVGHLGGIGKEEQEKIYAARFMGDRGFLVTFRQTDPLFTFDLSDPHAPKVVGEWKGPGFSTYLHPYGENHMIAMGREDWRLTVSLYDLTDFANPSLVERIRPGAEDGNYEDEEMESAALDDHKAFTFDAERELLALPFHGWFWNEYNEGYNTGILLYNVSHQGFEEAGRMNLLNAEDPDRFDEGMEQPTTRSVFIADTLYGISRCRITSADLNNPSNVFDTIALFTGTYCEEYDDEVWDDNETDTDWDEGDDWDDGDAEVDADVDMDADMDIDEDVTEPDTDSISEID